MTKVKYDYSPLDSPESQFRLLTLLPGLWQDEIRCSLAVYPFDSNASNYNYQTLSYVWGDPTVVRQIRVDDLNFQVTENLWLALRRLRHAESELLIWVDAIAINQQDKDEKSKQVAMMGDIYRRCCEVICWLGEDTEAVSAPYALTSTTGVLAFELLRLHAEDKHRYDNICYDTSSSSHVEVAAGYEAHFEALSKIIESPWWSRIWIVQELALPPKATLMFGSEYLPVEVLKDIREVERQHEQGCCKHVFSAYQFEGLIKKTKLFMSQGAASLLFIRLTARDGDSYPLPLLRSLVCANSATDPRDLYYGLLGLLPKSDLNPDYSLSPSAVFARGAVQEMNFSERLSMMVGFRSADFFKSPQGQGLKANPTWLAPTSFMFMRIERQDLLTLFSRHMSKLNASRGFYSPVTLVNDSSLLLKSIQIDTIRLVDTVTAGNGVSKTIYRWLQMLALDETSCWPPDPPQIGSLADAFWKTLLWNGIYNSDDDGKLSTGDYIEMAQWLRHVIDGSPPLANVHNPLSRYVVHTNLSQRSLFLTKTGMLGLGPYNTMPGDEVHVLIGANVPFVLCPHRKRLKKYAPNSVFESSVRQYTMIGDGYVHGIMNGEAMEERGEDSWETIQIW
ncbi:heterokaryon incompatibility protein-domain-containing protein [Massariosphaeria phaeospora]|uniref:Heterokaryon incompatibility protein-domain-containing protein n=1 Tax=Massariosphaeria phaeospora TaxID=100035 RepID=A0A7C8IE41_9PLEO|nr:heterokaryon incompatibility protein-domain-containing protein [Massariosphaeria phaeospora]